MGGYVSFAQLLQLYIVAYIVVCVCEAITTM